MPRPNTGYKLVTKKPRGYKEKFYFIRWYDRGRKREHSTGFPIREQPAAQAYFEEWLGERPVRPDGPCNPNNFLIADMLSLYADEHAVTVADPERIADCIDALLPYWGDKYVSDIKTSTGKGYQKRRGRKPGTVRRELGTLSAAGNYCVREGYLTSFPFVWLPEKPPAKVRWLTRQEAAKALREARKEARAKFHLCLFILIGIYTGARKASVLSLRWTQNTEGGWVDLERERIDFNPVSRTQTKKRRPIVPIPNRLLRFLEYARARTKSDYVIQIDGKPVQNIKRSFNTACKNAGLEDVTPHTLRHSAITWLLQAGVAPYDVAEYVGASVETITRVYGHHSPDYLNAPRDAMDRRNIPANIPATGVADGQTTSTKAG